MMPGEISMALFNVNARRRQRGEPAVHDGRPALPKAKREAQDEIERLKRQTEDYKQAHEAADAARCYLEDHVFLLERELAILKRQAAA